MSLKDKPENEFEIVLERLIEVSADLGAEEEKNKDYDKLKEEQIDLKNNVENYKLLYDDEFRKREDAEKRFLNIHRTFMKYKSEQENPMTKKIIESFLTLLFKENLIKTDKKTWISVIKMYRFLTGEKISSSRDTINNIINNIDNLEIISKSIDVDEIKDDIKCIKDKNLTDFVVRRQEFPLATVKSNKLTQLISGEEIKDVYNKLGKKIILDNNIRSNR